MKEAQQVKYLLFVVDKHQQLPCSELWLKLKPGFFYWVCAEVAASCWREPKGGEKILLTGNSPRVFQAWPSVQYCAVNYRKWHCRYLFSQSQVKPLHLLLRFSFVFPGKTEDAERTPALILHLLIYLGQLLRLDSSTPSLVHIQQQTLKLRLLFSSLFYNVALFHLAYFFNTWHQGFNLVLAKMSGPLTVLDYYNQTDDISNDSHFRINV